ncbi:putative FBD-associated F-box protein At1g61330 isoform X2 [Rhodamnia argentea]|uniref:FBD-associated F-box protein At1g61330 isoform X2 n=1 Tax=Rhodamnia argentea TaxID=178133 RepID=A0ABM3HYL1_9MYRT|nr:putative FBD-associated F-box protein At1g61330 isoform X2 [Rhodamnia argentea]
MVPSSSKRIKVESDHPLISTKKRRVRRKPLSDLPDDVLERIFTLLPIRQAVRAGVVSTRFKQVWLFSRNLHFGRWFTTHKGILEAISIIDHVFRAHAGPQIQSFKLYIDPTDIEPMVRKWIEISISKGVEELELNFIAARIDPFLLSRDLIDVESLRVLKLTFCEIDFPPDLNSLHLLDTLILKKVEITSEMIETLILNCTLLETLELVHCDAIHQLTLSAQNHKRLKVFKLGDCSDLSLVEIDAPSLRSFHFYGQVPLFLFEDISQLKDAVINFIPPKGFMRHSSIRNTLDDLANISILTVNSIVLEGISPNYEDLKHKTRGLPFSYRNLKEFQLILHGAVYCNTYDIAAFLNNCPFVEKVFIDLNECSFEGSIYWELHQKQELESFRFLCRLKFVKVKGFRFQQHEHELVKFFLQKAINLETLALVSARNQLYPGFYSDDIENYQKFIMWKTCPRARVTFSNDCEDKTTRPTHQKIWQT